MGSVTRRAPGGPERRGSVEARVLTAVEELLDGGRSFLELSVQDVADAAGVARSTFYVHFADKSELLLRLAEASTADMLGEGERWITGPRDGGPEELTAVCARIIAHYREHEPLLRAVGAALTYDPVIARWWRRRIDAFIDVTAERIAADRAAAGGPAEPDLARPTAAMVAWSIERTVSMTVAVTGPDDDPALARALARGVLLLLDGP